MAKEQYQIEARWEYYEKVGEKHMEGIQEIFGDLKEWANLEKHRQKPYDIDRALNILDKITAVK